MRNDESPRTPCIRTRKRWGQVGMRNENRKKRHDRGVALIIVLLVTALLIALVFEFAYGTRVSMRSAVNFRDNQRAYYLARSCVNGIALLLKYDLQQNLPQNDLQQLEWQPAPLQVAADTVPMVRWTDEGGKINVSRVDLSPAHDRLTKLFELKGIDQKVLDLMVDDRKGKPFYLLTELRQYMSDTDFDKVKDVLTVSDVSKINVNTASTDVLQCIGLSADMTDRVDRRRKQDQGIFVSTQDLAAFLGPENTMAVSYLDVTSNIFKVEAMVTVGGYTRQAEAIITRSTTGYAVNYWRIL